MQRQIQEIHEKAVEAATRLKRAEADLIEILQKADREKIHFHFGRTSLFDYVVQTLGLSEATAYNLITVARKAVEVPALQYAIRDGRLTVAKARKVAPVLTCENQEEWLSKAAALSSRKLEWEVALAQDPERARCVSVHLNLPTEVLEKLKRAQDLECQRQGETVSLEETLAQVLEQYLERRDPLRRAERAAKKGLASQLVTGQAEVPAPPENGKAIPAANLHRIHLRDQGQCTYRDPKTGLRCPQTRWIELHHLQPRRLDGSNSPSNISTLCSGHHRLEHFQLRHMRC